MQLIRINQLVEVVVEDDNKINTYHSRIEEINEEQMLIAMPSHRGMPVLLQPGAEVQVRFVLDGSVYQFCSIYRSRYFVPLPVWIVGPAYDFKKIQRRAFYRLESYLPVSLKLPDGPELNSGGDITLNLRTKDVSGGGIRVITKERFALGTEVSADILLPSKISVKTKGRVVRLETAAPDSSIYWVSIEFTDIEEHDRKKIVRFVFQKQLEQR